MLGVPLRSSGSGCRYSPGDAQAIPGSNKRSILHAVHPMAALDLIVAYVTRNYTFRFLRNAVLQDYNISNPQHTLYNDF